MWPDLMVGEVMYCLIRQSTNRQVLAFWPCRQEGVDPVSLHRSIRRVDTRGLLIVECLNDVIGCVGFGNSVIGMMLSIQLNPLRAPYTTLSLSLSSVKTYFYEAFICCTFIFCRNDQSGKSLAICIYSTTCVLYNVTSCVPPSDLLKPGDISFNVYGVQNTVYLDPCQSNAIPPCLGRFWTL